jgi:hypothetical protein
MDQLGEIQLECMLVRWGVRALHFAELALETRVDHGLSVVARELSDISIVLLVDGFEEDGEAVAVLEAHPTPMADLENSREFFLQCLGVPVFGLGGIVAQSGGGHIRDVGGAHSAREGRTPKSVWL